MLDWRYILKNDELEKALEETWKNKEKFYEETKGLSTLEILKRIEGKYSVQDAAYNQNRKHITI